MKNILILISIALLCANLFAQTYGIEMKYLEPNMTYAVQRLNTPNGQAVLVKIEGNETFIVKEWDGQIAKTKDEIYPILKSSLASSSEYEKAMNDTVDFLEKMKGKFLYSHDECFRLSGMDKFDCHDRESCVLAAFSTPISLTVVNADGFWQAMLDFKNQDAALLAELNGLENELSAGSIDVSESNSAKIYSRMQKIDGLEQTLDSHPFFLDGSDEGCGFGGDKVCYDFCPSQNWSKSRQEFLVLQTRWENAKTILGQMSAQDERASNIEANTLQWLEYTKNRDGIWAAELAGVQTKKNELDVGIAQVEYEKINDAPLLQEYVFWVLKIGQAERLAQDGQFYNAIKLTKNIANESDKISLNVNSDLQARENISIKLSNIKLTLQKMPTTFEPRAQIEQEYVNLSAQTNGVVDAASLQGLIYRSDALEQKALVAYAQSQLNILPQTNASTNGENANAPAQDIFSTIINALMGAINSVFGGK
ncbi:MAG: hypothetical protein WC492_00530 [Candidatus Micrarchaeia archaeon]